ncbi:josephin-domain protein [Rhizoctonia solani AG-3 Rhs1AP]|uniref:ubiquitinyl hydrolase 1 n=1 Tax=Rhizoctonia solani AG-3 Rhs1AP TaxID=1086054 RepID=X8JV99_9AGAM|nr:josephin-domain protein [Rhizoctonia solani AG-3 Rhs1AP]
MQGLGPYMYHERQEPGSMMCGQHALNSLLQGNYFTPPDLAQIAHEIDQLEQGVQDLHGGRSTNMDDTGYFSVQVLENALKNAFGLTLVRWRSEEMRQYQAVPDTQLAFILNLEQHWFTLRRFGHPGRKGHWFNLNSFLESPEWVGNTYLAMVLQQAEKEGYSVFVVRPMDPSNPENMLPGTEADLIAETLDPGDFGGQVQRISTTRTQAGSSNAIAGAGPSSRPSGFENEDVQLQRALQASITAGYGGGSVYEFPDEPATYTTRPSAPPVRAPSLGLGYGGDSGPPSRRTPVPAADDPPTPQFDDNDPVAASAARAKLRLEQMQREQAAAMQGMGGLGGGYETVDLDPSAAARRREAQDRVRRAREDEEAQIRRAMEASLRTPGQGETEDDLHYDTPPIPGAFGGGGNRDYDDEDAELQAALKASLESHAASSAAPSASARDPVPVPAVVRAPSAPAPNVPARSASTAKPAEDDEDEDEEEEEEEEEQAPAAASPEVEAKAELADPDEVRRRRLARFGG